MANWFRKPKKTKRWNSQKRKRGGRKTYGKSQKQAYWMGVGFGMARDTSYNSADVRFYGGDRAYESFVNGRSRMNDLDSSLGKDSVEHLFKTRKKNSR